MAANANIPIPRQEARTFKQHFENNMLRPELSGNFQTTEFFRIAKAYVVDDATNKQYDFFASKFVDLGNGIVYDTVTKLLWLKDADYFGKRMKINGAQKACENLNIAGLSGWRVPSKTELERMYTAYHKQEPHPFIKLSNGYYLSSTLVSRGRKGSYLIMVNFRERKDRPAFGNPGIVWPIRGSE